MSIAVSTPGDLVSMLDQLAQTIVTTLGFGVASINVVREDGEVEVASVVGDAGARQALLGSVHSQAQWQKCLEASEPWGRLRFLPHSSSRAQAGELGLWISASQRDLGNDVGEQAWHPEDALFAPLLASDGSLLGVLSVDLPGDGLRPDLAVRNALEAFADAAALAIEHATMRSRAEAAEQQLRSQARVDPLTGVGTRTLLLERLRHASTARPETATVMALAFVDLDGFKAINDQHSHTVGDHALRALAQRIQSAVRAHDTVARWGGDEFLVLLQPLTDEHAALGVVQRILSAVAEPMAHDGDILKVTASIGVSFWSSESPVECEELVRRADAAMYEVKRRGSNGYAVFDALDPEPSRRRHVLDLVARAVREQRVVVHYQPIVRVSDQRVVGVEALLRLRDDDELIFPLELLDDGATPPDVAQAVLVLATQQVARWVERGHDLSLSVNVSAQQVTDIAALTQQVTDALKLSGLSPERLVLELTEHALLATTTRTLQGIDALVADGVRLSLDDFGTGYASMTYVQMMPVHELKIDGSFLAEGSNPRTARAIVRSIASLASDLDLNCVAEGVETLSQHALVRESGVRLAQGVYYSPALDAASLTALLEPTAASGAQVASTR